MMSIALGRTKEDEYKEKLHEISKVKKAGIIDVVLPLNFMIYLPLYISICMHIVIF